MVAEFPVVTLPDSDHAALAAALPQRAQELLQCGDAMLTAPLVTLLDAVTERWARHRPIPFRDEITRIAAQLGRRGTWFANLNYEWGCSAAVLDDAAGKPMLARVLDWPFPRLGELAAIVHCQSSVGSWTNITWPGCVGVLQANAPGRFAASINQAPRRSFGMGRYLGLVAGWLHARKNWLTTQAVPPLLLLRQVMETAPDYAAALSLLEKTPVAAPVIFSLVGTQPDDYAIIQKSTAGTVVRHARCVTNCWLDENLPGDLGANDAPARLRKLSSSMALGDQFRWLQPPVLNQDSRLAVEMSPTEGFVRVQGWNGTQTVTAVGTFGGLRP